MSSRGVPCGDLVASNATFGALLFADIGNKLAALSTRHSQHEMQSLSLARVDDAFLRPAHFVDAGTDIVSVVRIFQAHRTSNVLVRDALAAPPRLGIFTTTALQRAVLAGTPLDELAVGGLSNFELVTVRPSDQICEALMRMLSYRVHRLVVQEGTEIRGVLEALDLLSFLSNHSHLITVQIDMAQDLAALGQAAARITRMVALLYRGGTRIPLIARLVQELNARLFERAWQLLAPAELVANSCLFVMGSEGRGEQLLKTDQDNALVLRAGYAPPADLDRITAAFSQALGSFGYPPCPGGIMLCNAPWCRPLPDFARTIREWLLLPTPESLMQLAIFVDAQAVCGDSALLAELRASVPRGRAGERCAAREFRRRNRCLRRVPGLVEPPVRARRRCPRAGHQERRGVSAGARRAQPRARRGRHGKRHGGAHRRARCRRQARGHARG